MKLPLSVIFSLILFTVGNVWAAGITCRPLLWPGSSPVINQSIAAPQDTVDALKKISKKLLHQPAYPIAILGSSGKVQLTDKHLVASRKAFQDAERAAVLALTYRLTHDIEYLNKTKDILISWAKINQPTGHPIDETRLDGMIWAYDLISCDLAAHDKSLLLNWFERLRSKKAAWRFGKVTRANNHRIHQLKMLLLLDKILDRNQGWQADMTLAEKYSNINLDPQTGKSVDYIQRSALYYHNYVMQAWLEISLVTDCCKQPINQAFAFLKNKIVTQDIKNEFSHSQAKIDAARATHGFEYAKKGGTFDIMRAAPTILVYYTLNRSTPDPKLWLIQEDAKLTPKIIFLKARRVLW